MKAVQGKIGARDYKQQNVVHNETLETGKSESMAQDAIAQTLLSQYKSGGFELRRCPTNTRTMAERGSGEYPVCRYPSDRPAVRSTRKMLGPPPTVKRLSARGRRERRGLGTKRKNVASVMPTKDERPVRVEAVRRSGVSCERKDHDRDDNASEQSERLRSTVNPVLSGVPGASCRSVGFALPCTANRSTRMCIIIRCYSIKILRTDARE